MEEQEKDGEGLFRHMRVKKLWLRELVFSVLVRGDGASIAADGCTLQRLGS